MRIRLQQAVFVFIGHVALVAPVASQVPFGAGASPQIAADTRVEGVVIERVTGRPLPGALLSLGSSSALSDTVGRFSIAAPAGDPVPLRAELRGFRHEATELFRSGEAVLARVELARVALAFSFDLKVAPLSIEGVIRGENDRPVSSAQVLIPGSRLGTLSRGDGSFRLALTDTGTYVIRVQEISYGAVEDSVRVAFGPGIRLDASLTRGAQDCEFVVTGEERPSNGLRVFIRDLTTARAPQTTAKLQLMGQRVRDSIEGVEPRPSPGWIFGLAAMSATLVLTMSP